MDRSSKQFAVLLVILGLGGAVAVHHGMPNGMSMGGGHGEHTATVCPAVLTAGTVVAIVGTARRRRQRRAESLPRTPLARRKKSVIALLPTAARSRDGPKIPLFLLLGVLQR